MDIIKKFGEMVGSTSLKDAKKARKLLLLGYQLQEKRLLLAADCSRSQQLSGRPEYVFKQCECICLQPASRVLALGN